MAGTSRQGKPKAARAGKTETVSAPGKKPIEFEKGGLHKSTGTPQGQPIPAAKMQAALDGKLGPKAKQQAEFKKNVLTGPKGGGNGNRKGRRSS